MEKKSLYREFFPGYMGHIPLKSEVIGMTVGATNDYIKSSLTKEPDMYETFVPSTKPDYTFYNKGYFNQDMAKSYPLEEDKIYSNRSKEARTWICGNKHQWYPQHIPGYTGHVTGLEASYLKGALIFGMGYSKATSVAIKGEHCNKYDLPKEERYISEMKNSFNVPKMRSKEEEKVLEREKEIRNSKLSGFVDTSYGSKGFGKTVNMDTSNDPMYAGMSDAFKKAIGLNKKPTTEMPYVVGYGGFRQGVIAGNNYGKNFKEVSLRTINERKIKEYI